MTHPPYILPLYHGSFTIALIEEYIKTGYLIEAAIIKKS